MKYLFLVLAMMITLMLTRVFMTLSTDHFEAVKAKKLVAKQSESEEEQLIRTGKDIYLVYCSSCHGKDGKGNNGKAHNHTKRIANKSVVDIINNGSNNFKSLYPAGMPAGLVDEKEAKKIAAYIASGLQGERPESWQVCASCHSENGEGIAYVAPNLKIYTDEFVSTVLSNGKKGVIGRMPSFKGRLDTNQMRAVATYIRSLNKE